MEFPHLQQIYLECRKEEGIYPPPLPHAEVLLPSEPVAQNRYINLLKLMIMIEHIKLMQIPYLDIWPMHLSGQCLIHRRNASHLFWNLEDPVLVQTLSYKRKITYCLLLIGFFQKTDFNGRYWT